MHIRVCVCAVWWLEVEHRITLSLPVSPTEATRTLYCILYFSHRFKWDLAFATEPKIFPCPDNARRIAFTSWLSSSMKWCAVCSGYCRLARFHVFLLLVYELAWVHYSILKLELHRCIVVWPSRGERKREIPATTDRSFGIWIECDHDCNGRPCSWWCCLVSWCVTKEEGIKICVHMHTRSHWQTTSSNQCCERFLFLQFQMEKNQTNSNPRPFYNFNDD